MRGGSFFYLCGVVAGLFGLFGLYDASMNLRNPTFADDQWPIYEQRARARGLIVVRTPEWDHATTVKQRRQRVWSIGTLIIGLILLATAVYIDVTI